MDTRERLEQTERRVAKGISVEIARGIKRKTQGRAKGGIITGVKKDIKEIEEGAIGIEGMVERKLTGYTYHQRGYTVESLIKTLVVQLPTQKMVATILLLLTFLLRNEFVISNDTENFSVVSTSTTPSELDHAQLEMRSVVNALKESLSKLQNMKQGIIEEIKNEIISKTDENFRRQLTELKNKLMNAITESIMKSETKFKELEERVNESRTAYYSNIEKKLTETKNEIFDKMNEQTESTKLLLENQLIKTKQQIVSETKENVREQLTEVKNEMLVKINASEESTKLAISKNEDLALEIQSVCQSVKEQLTKTNIDIIQEIVELKESRVAVSSDLRKTLNETKNYIVDEMKSVLSDNEKHIERMQAQLNETKAEIAELGDFNEMKNQLAKTQQKILVEIQQCRSVPEDCREIQKRGYNTSGIYRIQPRLSLQSFLVWCELSDYGGGWTYVVNRFDGSQNFYLKWTDYKQGFGNLSGEHWIGLDHLYELTNSNSVELLIELLDWDLYKVYALYDDFRVGNEAESYPLKTFFQISNSCEI
ncbi:hypothetical protein Zmor_024415 [Zophobas morio]|uniref:Fibrinogen C-terminal domain-containing protein n=1 Tax=Zophobas morio TaxID=2755281 RepID=A0AA38I067_9CUCU|nr:hypothetical protein Zmor_024415 [Zophobas morio]